jgi:hypothetical protein
MEAELMLRTVESRLLSMGYVKKTREESRWIQNTCGFKLLPGERPRDFYFHPGGCFVWRSFYTPRESSSMPDSTHDCELTMLSLYYNNPHADAGRDVREQYIRLILNESGEEIYYIEKANTQLKLDHGTIAPCKERQIDVIEKFLRAAQTCTERRQTQKAYIPRIGKGADQD